MGMTMTQKILAAHAGLDSVVAGQLIEAKLDMVLGNDVTSPVAINEMNKFGKTSVFDKTRISLVMDHFTPNKDIQSAENCKQVREFARKNDILHYYDVGNMGIEHALLPEKGIVTCGDCIIGADSHTCTYGALGAFSTGVGSTDMAAGMVTGKAWFKVPSAIKVVITGKKAPYISGKDVVLHLIGEIGVDGALYKSLEFTGDGIKELSMDDRLCISNMAIECGAKNGIFPVDDVTIEYVTGRSLRDYKVYEADADAEYDSVVEIDLSKLEPTVACPHLPENTKTASELEKEDIKIDQVVIGSCTNGRMEDMRNAAEILKGKKVAKGVRCIVIPATQAIYLQCVKEGIVETFIEAGAIVSTPTCGPCLGGHMGILASGEKAVSTSNRNFVGRMGHTKSEIYLASPAVAAASAVKGCVADPRNI
ncbi:MAG: 3-isopropylmalate dehydratase large subunit [Eubacterium sp.]